MEGYWLMAHTYLDIEADFSIRKDMKGKEYSDFANPYNETSRLVVGGMIRDGEYSEFTSLPNIPKGDTIIGHNIKYDAKWLKALGLDSDAYSYQDTLLREFVGGCGTLRIQDCGLAKAAARRLGRDKPDLVSKFWKMGYNTSDIPSCILRSYLKSDVYNTTLLYWAQEKDPNIQRQKKYLNFAHDVLKVLVNMEHAGLGINEKDKAAIIVEMKQNVAKNKVLAWEQLEKACGKHYEYVLQQYIDKGRKTEFVDSADIGEIIYSLKVRKDKAEDFKKFASRFRPHKKGAQAELDFAIANYCEKLDYGLKVKPHVGWMQSAQVVKGIYIGATGFKADSKMLNAYLDGALVTKKQEAFIKTMLEYSKAKVQYNSSLNSILKGIRDDGKCHGNFNQCGTVSMRFSSTEPRQNWAH